MAKQQEAKEQEAAGLPSEEADEVWCSAPCLTAVQSRIPASETVPPHSGWAFPSSSKMLISLGTASQTAFHGDHTCECLLNAEQRHL